MSDSKDSTQQRALLLTVLVDAGFLSNTVAASDLKLLTGGFWNQVYRLQVGEKILVIKQFFKGVTNPMFPVMPDTEAAALSYLQGSACAPEPIAYLPQTPAGDILLYGYVAGLPWKFDPLNAEKCTKGVADLLARVHRTPIDANAKNSFRLLPHSPKELYAHSLTMLGECDETVRRSLEHLKQQLADCPLTVPCEPVLVHTDCGPGNIIVGEAGPCLIDWQCPGLGDPLQDVFTFASPAMQILYHCEPLADGVIQHFFQSYFQAQSADSDLEAMKARLPLVQVYHHFRFAAYCAYRITHLQASQPAVAALYSQAFSAELVYLNRLVSNQ
jgi:aminoglycoside phosphotransferase (APT) family kinase protein